MPPKAAERLLEKDRKTLETSHGKLQEFCGAEGNSVWTWYISNAVATGHPPRTQGRPHPRQPALGAKVHDAMAPDASQISISETIRTTLRQGGIAERIDIHLQAILPRHTTLDQP